MGETMVKIEDGNEPEGKDLVNEAEAIVEEAAEEVAAEQAAESEAAGSGESEANAESAEAEPTPEEQLATAQAEAKEWQDKFMRLHAEWDTYRRRTNEQRAEEKTRATEGLVENLLPVIDDFERSIGYADENGETGLLDGVKQVHAKLVEVLLKNGVEVIDPAGGAFDALEAQAVAKVEDSSVPDETVAEVYQKGYRMGRKVIRPAMVTVTTGGPAREADDLEEEKTE
ncbi:MAG: nucleotide exchange factor GrpE [Eggerthellaceae bacterium]|nr:nucleotide exchange factor GrpE [Eggerthellaceae bacterium]